MKSLLYVLLTILSILATGKLKAQEIYSDKGVLIQAGITAVIGAPVNRFGAKIEIEFSNEAFVWKNQIHTYFSITGLGPKLKHGELRFSTGAHYNFGKSMRDSINVRLFEIDHLSKHYAIGLTFRQYLNPIKTTQSTGIVSLRIGKVSVVTENDAFGNINGKDEFRTGSVAFSYLSTDQIYTLNTQLYTGRTFCPDVQKITDSNYPARWGYVDNSACPEFPYSHGLFSFEVFQNQNNGNYAVATIGHDDDRVRNNLQNNIMHDMPWLPDHIEGNRNLHIPMLDRKGQIYLYEEDQKIRKVRPVIQLGYNRALFF